DLEDEIAEIDGAVEGLRLNLDTNLVTNQDPAEDARYTQLGSLIEELLRENGQWKDDERLVIFTEYKTTLDYLLRRLRHSFPGGEERFLSLFGGMDDLQREQIKEKFNDPQADVRVLVATDAASEGLNLQNTARHLLHFDCPWNPSRLEQRNGRLDRHGQARDVWVYHYASDEDADLKFMAYLISKVDTIREDLGATSELFDEATHRCLIEGESVEEVQKELDVRIELVRDQASVDADDAIVVDEASDEAANLDALADELDLDHAAQHSTLEAAMSVHAGRPQLSPLDERHRCKILQPSLTGWSDTIDAAVRRSATGSGLGPVPHLAFSASPFMEEINGRPIFRPRIDTMMVHLGHPLMGKAINWLTRRRFPGPQAVSRWTVRLGDVPDGADALILLSVEELAVNELRETFHHWIRTLAVPVAGDELGQMLHHAPAVRLRGAEPCRNPQIIDRARDLLSDVEPDLQEIVKNARSDLTSRLQDQLEVDGQQARKEEQERYQSRQGEVSALIAENSLAKLEKEIARLKRERQQGRLFENQAHLDELDKSLEIKKEELQRRTAHYEEVREQLAKERQRILNRLLPRRYALQGEAQVFPVAVEVRFAKVVGG
ncbi:MAG: helicase-related protein, partial [Pirellulaceae bacterium]